MVELHVERTIAASPERVFDWLADPASLTAAPPVLRARWVKGPPGPGVGALRRVIGVGTWFREEITSYDRPRSYSYLIVRSFPPFNHEGG
ncbi:MAG: SRPBCC family protein, partial [Mycobacterium sp.]